MRSAVRTVVGVFVAIGTIVTVSGCVPQKGGASPASIVVIPGSGLTDGKVVTVNGRNLEEIVAAAPELLQCRGALLDEANINGDFYKDCEAQDSGHWVQAPAPDQDGNFTASFTVHRDIVVGPDREAVDCGTTAQDCAIAAVRITRGGPEVLATAIGFRPN